MNILIINGSPRKKGLISQTLDSTCTTPWPFSSWFNQSRDAIRAMRDICRYSGFKIVATIERGGTAMHPQLSEKDKQKCRKTIGKL